jgi:hypothetical protein
VDQLPDEEAARFAAILSERFGKSVRQISATQSEGIADWAVQLRGNAADAKNILREIDYDTYAAGEAVLGWLNATAEVIGQPAFDPRTVVWETFGYLQKSCVAQSAEIAHIKLALSRKTDDQKRIVPGPFFELKRCSALVRHTRARRIVLPCFQSHDITIRAA